jgi:hypothetical protein
LKKKDVELYLSEDIIQGEKVPFYLLWKRDDINSFEIEMNGFSKVDEYHNIKNEYSYSKNIMIKDITTPYYFGGILSTEISEVPYIDAFLKVKIILNNGEYFELIENRKLYNTILKINSLPDCITIPLSYDRPPIELNLKGSTTTFIDIDSKKDSELKVELPKEIFDVYKKFINSVTEGFITLKKEYPEYSPFLEFVLVGAKKRTRQQYLDELQIRTKNLDPNESFKEALQLCVINAILSQASIRDIFFRPLLEYFASSSEDRIFLMSPFLGVNVKKGRGTLKLNIKCQNILEYYKEEGDDREDGDAKESYSIETKIQSDKDMLVPLRNLICFRRI